MGRLSVLLLVLLMAAGVVLSGALVLQHHGEPLGAAEAICDAASGGCDAVAQSAYSSIQGVSLAGIGLVFYLSLLLLFGLSALAGETTRQAAAGLGLVAVAVALVVDLMLLGVQAFAIGAFCTLCLLTYAVNAAALFLLWSARSALGSGLRALGQSDGRLALAGWLAGSLAVAAAVGVLELALADRAETRQAHLLGDPGSVTGAAAADHTAPPAAGSEEEQSLGGATDVEPDVAPPAPTEASTPAAAEGDLEAQLVAARAQTRRLQEILDDPRKLAQYQDRKAQQDWETAERQPLDLARTPVKGAEGAPIQVVEYSDFMCPFCKNLAQGLDSYLPESGGRLRIFFKQYPLDKECNTRLTTNVHPGACRLALGGICAQEQDRFWPYHDAVFAAATKEPSLDSVADLAVGAGLDGARFRECLLSPAARKTLEQEIAEGVRVGVEGTPTVFINGKKLPRLNDFMRAVESEARRLGLAPTAAPAPAH